jgi:acetylornithine/N-succinyldiaminopimelate aminotransferase
LGVPPPEHAHLQDRRSRPPDHGGHARHLRSRRRRAAMIPALMPTYSRADLAFERGEGAWLITEEGRRYLDFGAGIATSSLGHGHPHLVAAIAEQAGRVMHVSNLYRVKQAERLAERLVSSTFADSVFFCNSGAEANEGMVKMVRRAMAATGRPERTRMICFEGAFHGRTLAMLAATGNAKYLKGFGPEVDGFDHVPFNNLNAVRDAIGPHTAGIVIEPVQGEGGIRPAYLQFLRDLRTTCDEFGIFLGLDEIQCGMGRSGKLFAYEWAGIEPDVLTAAKGIAGGFPMGAILARESVAKYLTAGTHGTTFGGNPLACAAANAVLDVVLAPGFLAQVDRNARIFWRGLVQVAAEFPDVFEDARGAGLLLGLKCVVPNTDVQAALVAEGLLSVGAGDNVIRFAPPLIVGEAEIAEALQMIRRGARRCLPSAAQVAAK